MDSSGGGASGTSEPGGGAGAGRALQRSRSWGPGSSPKPGSTWQPHSARFLRTGRSGLRAVGDVHLLGGAWALASGDEPCDQSPSLPSVVFGTGSKAPHFTLRRKSSGELPLLSPRGPPVPATFCFSVSKKVQFKVKGQGL